MPDYLVEWSIDITARSPTEAAKKALEIQRRAGSMATVFDVTNANGRKVKIDLDNPEENCVLIETKGA